jgi:hypothetical protein
MAETPVLPTTAAIAPKAPIGEPEDHSEDAEHQQPAAA